MRFRLIPILGILFCYIVSSAFGNDSQFTIRGGEIVPIEKNASAIRLLNENLTFSFSKDTFDVEIEYTFISDEEDLEVDVGFPIHALGVNNGAGRIRSANNGFISNFRTSANGVLLNATERTDVPVMERDSGNNTKSVRIWYLSKIRFPKAKKTIVTVSYSSEYSRRGSGYQYATYLYGTGNTWKNGIERLNITLRINDAEFVTDIDAPFLRGPDKENAFHGWSNRNNRIISLENVNPDVTDKIDIAVNEFNWIDGALGAFDAQSQFGNSQPNFLIDVSLLTAGQLKMMRNAFYAKWNYSFKSQELVEFFKKNMSGYSPIYTNVESKLTEIQRLAIAKILAEETGR